MSFPVRSLFIAAAVVATLSACHKPKDEPAAPAAPGAEAPSTPADAAAPMAYEAKTPYANVKLTLPEAIRPQTDLHARLYAEEVRKLHQFSEGAQADRSEAGDDPTLPTYEETVTLSLAGETGKLFSLKRVAFDYTGGAHPNTISTGVLWDKALKRLVTPAELFRKRADLAPLDQILCSALNTAKRARVPDGPVVDLGGKTFSCPRAIDTPFVLAPAVGGGKAAGLIFLVGPYQVGPYAEGPYEIAIPAAAFRSLLASAYVDEFGGDLARAGDVTPTAR